MSGRCLRNRIRVLARGALEMNPEELEWETTENPLPHEVARVDSGLDLFNHQAADLTAVGPIACFVRSKAGDVIGGAIARHWGKCCEVQQLWVAEEYRSIGIGRRLLARVEERALRLNCVFVYLETFSFQAPEFYRALGYNVACEFSGFPDGICKLVLQKTLSGDT